MFTSKHKFLEHSAALMLSSFSCIEHITTDNIVTETWKMHLHSETVVMHIAQNSNSYIMLL